jgi:hypothetical protein
MPDPCRVLLARDLAELYESIDTLATEAPRLSVSMDSLHVAIAPLSKRFPKGEKLLYFGILVAIERCDTILRQSDAFLADSLADARTRIRLATYEPTKNPYANQYVALLSARLHQLDQLVQSLAKIMQCDTEQTDPARPSIRDVDSIQSACTYVHQFFEALLRQARQLTPVEP